MPKPRVAASDHESIPWAIRPPLEYGEPMADEAALGIDAPDDDNADGGWSNECELECAGDPSGVGIRYCCLITSCEPLMMKFGGS
jgi:hypothetical protein